MSAQTVLAVVGTVLGLTGVLGIAYAVFRSATVQKTLDLYRGENEALGKAVARHQADLQALQAKAQQLEQANRVLQETVSGRAAVEELAARLAEFQRDRMTEHHDMMGILREVRDQMGELWRGVVRMLGDR